MIYELSSEEDLGFAVHVKNIGDYKGVGEAKLKTHELVSSSQRDWFLELDHDDYLPSDAIELLYQYIEENPDAWFIYSDFFEVDESDNILSPRFSERYGWEYGADVFG